MQFEVSFEIDLSVLANLSRLMESIRPGLAAIVRDTGSLTVAQWTREASLALKNPSTYIQKIEDGLEYPFDGDPLHLVIVNRHAAAAFFEEGYDAFDMKKMLSTSAKVKTGKDGKRYLHIPFQHSEQSLQKAGIDPKEYRTLAASKMIAGASSKTKWGERLTDMGNLGKQRKFFSVSTGKLARFDNKGTDTGSKLGTVDYTWKASPFENVSRFEDRGGQTSHYSSFRTISENSDPAAWIHPGLRAMRIAETTAKVIRPQFERAVAETVRKTIQAALRT